MGLIVKSESPKTQRMPVCDSTSQVMSSNAVLPRRDFPQIRRVDTFLKMANQEIAYRIDAKCTPTANTCFYGNNIGYWLVAPRPVSRDKFTATGILNGGTLLHLTCINVLH